MNIVFADEGLAYFALTVAAMLIIAFVIGVLAAVYGIVTLRRGEIPFFRPKRPVVMIDRGEDRSSSRKRPRTTAATVTGVLCVILGIGLVVLVVAVISGFNYVAR